ncbi:MAG: carbonic anhydrase [Acidimicrobiales bacterium]
MCETNWDRLVEAHNAARSEPSREDPPRHQPTAAVLACSDARVPPSVIFDQPAGSLFVVRIAGNSASPAALASFDYAVDALGVELIAAAAGRVEIRGAIHDLRSGQLRPLTKVLNHNQTLSPVEAP